MEKWKDVKNYEGSYQVSNLGRVKSLKRKKEIILNRAITNKYYSITLCKDGIKCTRNIHQLVAISFLNHIPNGSKLVVNHINHNKLDNRVDNLEVITNRENANQKHIRSTSRYTGVSWCKTFGKWVSKIHIDGKDKHLGRFNNEQAAAKVYQNKLKEIR